LIKEILLGHRILIIDPFKNLLNIYQIILEKEGYQVDLATHLQEALPKFAGESYPVVITEFLPPFEDTLQFLRQIKSLSTETYIIIVTNATLDGGTYEQLFENGADDLILKPYSQEKILVHIRKGFRIRSIIVQNQELKRTSLTDPVSVKIEEPIFNPVHFRRCLRQELKRSRRHQRLFSFLLMEVPYDALDKEEVEGFLAELLRVIRKNIREEDIIGRENGRYGIYLPETDEVGSNVLVERLTRLLRNHPRFTMMESLKSASRSVSFQSYTYPDRFALPDSLQSILI
jgi:PleD family two-component response regulator